VVDDNGWIGRDEERAGRNLRHCAIAAAQKRMLCTWRNFGAASAQLYLLRCVTSACRSRCASDKSGDAWIMKIMKSLDGIGLAKRPWLSRRNERNQPWQLKNWMAVEERADEEIFSASGLSRISVCGGDNEAQRSPAKDHGEAGVSANNGNGK